MLRLWIFVTNPNLLNSRNNSNCVFNLILCIFVTNPNLWNSRNNSNCVFNLQEHYCNNSSDQSDQIRTLRAADPETVFPTECDNIPVVIRQMDLPGLVVPRELVQENGNDHVFDRILGSCPAKFKLHVRSGAKECYMTKRLFLQRRAEHAREEGQIHNKMWPMNVIDVCHPTLTALTNLPDCVR